MKTNNGGPAFPQSSSQGDPIHTGGSSMGMTLRDWFAGQAAAALVTSPAAASTAPKGEYDTHIAEMAYELADALIAVRDKEL